MNFLEQLYELNEQNYRVVELNRNRHYELIHTFSKCNIYTDEYEGDVQRAVCFFYEKYVKKQDVPKVCDCCGNKMSLRQCDFTPPYWYCGNCNGN